MSGRRAALVYLVALAGVLPGCAGTREAPADNAALADTLSGLIAEAYSFDSPDAIERMAGLYAPGEHVVSASGGRLTVSADSVRSGIERFWTLAGQNMRNPRWTWHEVHVERLGDDAAVLTGTWSIPHIALDDQPHVIEGAWTAVFRRINGEWKIIQEHLSSPGG